jgi:lambda family phage portal protein
MPVARMRYRVKGSDNVYIASRARMEVVPNPISRAPSPRVVRWLGATGGPNSVGDISLASLRSSARKEIRDNGLADAGVDVLVSNIVGSGIKPQFATANADLNKRLAQLWLEWTDESDADGRLDFYGQQALAARSMIEGGDVFGRMRVRQIGEMETVPLQVQVVEAEYCPLDKNQPGAPQTDTSGALNPIRAGVEFDLIGRRVAYHLTREHPLDGIPLGSTSNLTPIRVPASEVVHLALIRRPGQVRGEPWLSRAIAKLHDLDAYDDAQLVRQKIAALFTGFVRTDPNQDGDEGAIFAGQTDPYGDGVALASLEPGTMQVLDEGQSIDWASPPSPGDNYEEFVREQKRAVAVSVGVMYEQLTGDYSKVNDRTFRASVNEFRRRCAMWQHHLLVFQFCRPILRRWIELGVLAGKITLPAGVTIAQAARAKWLPEQWAYINPVQDVAAKKAERRAGFKSRASIISEGGYDVEEVDAEIAAENLRADQLGLVYDSDPRKTAEAGNAQPDDEPAQPAGT